MRKFKVISTNPLTYTIEILDMSTKKTYYYKLQNHQRMSQFRFGSVIKVRSV